MQRKFKFSIIIFYFFIFFFNFMKWKSAMGYLFINTKSIPSIEGKSFLREFLVFISQVSKKQPQIFDLQHKHMMFLTSSGRKSFYILFFLVFRYIIGSQNVMHVEKYLFPFWPWRICQYVCCNKLCYLWKCDSRKALFSFSLLP